jgi:ABC-type uncharacterized transport system ATPase subunit
VAQGAAEVQEVTALSSTSTPSPAPPPALAIKDISIAFGGLKAVSDFSMDLPAGGLYGLIGPNGAGKTTRAAVHDVGHERAVRAIQA